MRHIMTCLIASAVAFASLSATWGADQQADRAAITKAAESYTAAFNARDAKALADHWSPEAVYINPLTGNQVEGREAIAKEFKGILDNLKETKLVVQVGSIRFISPSVAVENGVAKLISAKGDEQESTYAAIHIKRSGKWLLDRVTEESVPVVRTHYDKLKALEWMIGKWVDGDNDSTIDTTCEWTRNKNFIRRSFAVSVQGQIEMSGMQLIGWDPVAKRIRSWVFDSDGGFAEGQWTKKENRWSIVKTGTLADGSKATSVNIITYVDDNQFTWQSINRTVGGKLLPNIDETVVVRSDSSE